MTRPKPKRGLTAKEYEAARLLGWKTTVLMAESMCNAVRVQIEKRLSEVLPKRGAKGKKP